MKEVAVSGKCHCGRITYKAVADPQKVSICHCSDCGGTPVYSAAIKDTPTYSLRVGCLAQRAQLPPLKRIWCRSEMDWSINLEGIPGQDRQ